MRIENSFLVKFVLRMSVIVQDCSMYNTVSGCEMENSFLSTNNFLDQPAGVQEIQGTQDSRDGQDSPDSEG